MHNIDKVQIDISNLSAVVGGWPRGNHAEIQRHLNILGMKDVHMTNNFEEVRQNIAKDKADLFLCNVNGDRSEAHSINHGVRHQEIGKNPFLVMISIVRPKNKLEIEETIDSGPDDLLMAPFRRDMFINRVKEIGVKRKKFVATASFVGPTRRSSARPGQKSAPEFDVPNPVQSLGTGVPRDIFWKEIETAAVQLNSRKMNSDVDMINALVEEIIPDYENSNIGEDFRRRMTLLQSSINALHNRAMRLGHVDIANLCDMAGNIIIDIKEQPIPPNLRHLKVMPKLMQGFQAALETLNATSGSA